MSIQMVFFIILSIVAVLLIAMVRINRSKRRVGTGPAVNSEVYVGNLNYRTQEQDLKQHFSQYGKINEVKIIKNNRTGRSKGYAFIRYASANEAEGALVEHGEQFNSRALVVRIAKSQAHD